MRKLLLGAAVLLALILAVFFVHQRMSRTQDAAPVITSTLGGAALTPGKDVSQYAVRSLWVAALAYDAQGNLWVGTEDDGLYFMSADRSICRKVTTTEGLGDMSVYAVAVDAAGRVWAGHRASGVSVFEGGAWKNYNMVNGPLGHRVFDIAANPRSSDVWIATDCGVTQYVAASATWKQHTTLDGLPSNATYRVAIADDDTVVVGLQADGLAVARPADGYRQWRHIDGPLHAPVARTGKGLPSCQINDLAMDGNSMWVATPFGVAHAGLSDLVFTFWRGADWEEKAQMLRIDPAVDLEQQMPAMLKEDYVVRIELLADGKLALGYRQQGVQTLPTAQLLNGDMVPDAPMRDTGVIVTALALNPAGHLAMGTYGRGVTLPSKGNPAALATNLLSMPPVQGARAPSMAEVEALMPAPAPGAVDGSVVAFMGDDWAIQGDTANHYGRQLMYRPWTGTTSWLDYYKVNIRTGDAESVYTYFPDIDQKDRRHLFNVTSGKRVQGEWNDGSWQQDKYPPAADGPDLWFDVAVPEGVHRVSLLFINGDAHDGMNANRDYFLEVKPFRDAIADAEALPSLCRARVVNFYMPVLKQFALSGGRYYIKVTRQHSQVTKCSALFIDRLNGTPARPESGFAPFMDVCKDYVPHAIKSDASDSTPAGRLGLAWNATAAGCQSNASASSLVARRMQLYRAASAGGLPEAQLSAMRWELPYVREQDRQQFDEAMVTAFERHLDQHPMTLSGVFWSELGKASQPWYRFNQKRAPRPAQFDLDAKSLGGSPVQIKSALAQHLACRGQDLFSSHSGEMTSEDPAAILKQFRSPRGNESLRLGELLALGESHLLRDTPKKQRVGLAICVASVRLAMDQLHDTLAAQAIFAGFILPNAAVASGSAVADPLSVSSLSALAQEVYPPAHVAAVKGKLAELACGKVRRECREKGR